MHQLRPKISFYIPPDKFKSSWPKSLKDDWISFGGGAKIWTYFTAIVLKEKGYPVDITTEIPKEGIVLSHSRYLPQRRLVNDKAILICIRADYGRNHMAHMHIVQNLCQVYMRGRDFLEKFFLPGPSYYIPYWPQPGLIPRHSSRGDRFENVVYMGTVKNLKEELRTTEWAEELAKERIVFKIVGDQALWHDYSQVDAICAIRSRSSDHHLRKPPSKLINAWLAHTPAILGPESSYRALRETELDYIEAKTLKQVRDAILRLRDQPSLRQKMVANGIKRARNYTVEANANRWIDFFERTAIPYYFNWRNRSNFYKKTFYFFFAMLEQL